MSIPSETTHSNLIEARLRAGFPTWYPGGKIDQLVRKICFHEVENKTEKILWNLATNFSVIEASVGPYSQDGGGAQRTAATLGVDNTPQTSPFQRFGDYVEVDTNQEAGLMQDQIKAKKAGLVRRLGDQVLNGDGQVPNLDGFLGKITAAQTHVKSVPTLLDWHLLASLVTASDGSTGVGPDCFVCCELMWRYLLSLITASGADPHFQLDADLGVPVLHFLGIPVYVGQNATNEGVGYDETSVWAVKLTGETGVRLCHIGGDSSEFGIEVRDLDRFSPTYAYKARFVGGYYALLVPEEESIARMSGITTNAGTLGLPTQVPPV